MTLPEDITPGVTAGHNAHTVKIHKWLNGAHIDVRDWGPSVGTGNAGNDTAALQAAVNEAQSKQGTVRLARRMTLNAPIRIINPLGLIGGHRYGTKVFVDPAFPVDGTMFEVVKDLPAGSLYTEEQHVPGFTFRDFTVYGNKRGQRVNVFRFEYIDRIHAKNVDARWVKGTVWNLYASVRESVFDTCNTQGCGDVANDRPIVDMRDRGSADGHNLNRFINFDHALACGDGFVLGAGATSTAVRANIISGIWHGMAETMIAGHDNEDGNGVYYGVPIERTSVQAIPVRLIDSSNNTVALSRLHHQGRGLPLISMEADDAAAINSLQIFGNTMGTNARGRNGYAPLACAVDATANTFTVDALGFVHSMSTGSRVQLAGAAPGGTALATDYYAIRDSATVFRLATSRANALAGTAIDITTAPTNTLFVQFDIGVTAVDTATDTLTAHGHILRTGARVRVAGTTIPGGLAADTDYFVIQTSADTLKLAVHKAAAKAGTAIDITSTGSAVFLTTVEFPVEVDTGVLSVGINDWQTTPPKRAYIRTSSGATTTGNSGSGASAGLVGADPFSSRNRDITVPFVETHNNIPNAVDLFGPVSIPNNSNYSSFSTAGVLMALMRVSTANGVLMGNLSGTSAIVSVFSQLLECLRLTDPADGNTALLVRRNVGGTASLVQVSMGAADSGGAGFKVLRVPN